jgi:membrane protease YdiL (CAAX protease family)
VAEDRRRQARRGLAVYFGLVIVSAAAIEGAMIASGAPITEQRWLVMALMWSPTVAMIIARLALREGFRDVSFRLGFRNGGYKEWLIAWLYPIVPGVLAYGAAWGTGLAPFAAPAQLAERLPMLPAAAQLVVSIALGLTLVTLFSAITAAGEEFGWRGYMLTRLIDAGVPRPVLVSGLVWGFWHMPLILTGQYAAGPHPVLSAALFLVGITAAGYAFARVRLASGSVWPAVLFHASWNAVIQGSFDAFTAGHDAAHAGNIWVGESGILVCVANVAVAIALSVRPLPMRRRPDDADSPLVRLVTL